jgi:hypothetical protein
MGWWTPVAIRPDADLAALLQELKDRSGLSYGALAGRLHVSTSTLHRYCSGAAVPAAYAIVEQFVRLCRATPDERDEAYRRWVLADASRGRGAPARGGPDTVLLPPEAEARPAGEPAPEEPEAFGVTAPGPGSHERSRGRGAVLVGVVLVALALALAVAGFAFGRSFIGRPSVRPQGLSAAATSTTAGPAVLPSAGPATGSTAVSSTWTAAFTISSATRSTPSAAPAPLTVVTQPFAWPDPCSPAYLVNRPPAQVPARPEEQDAPNWARRLGAVTADNQYVEVTVQGTGPRTVVLRDLSVRVRSRGAPLQWNVYRMGEGCGGGVGTGYFELDLDRLHPVLVGRDGQHLLPLKVSESDPEVLYVAAHTDRHDVSWDLELDWSSGSRQGRLRIDDNGRPFRTSAGNDQKAYYPPDAGDTGWRPAQG